MLFNRRHQHWPTCVHSTCVQSDAPKFCTSFFFVFFLSFFDKPQWRQIAVLGERRPALARLMTKLFNYVSRVSSGRMRTDSKTSRTGFVPVAATVLTAIKHATDTWQTSTCVTVGDRETFFSHPDSPPTFQRLSERMMKQTSTSKNRPVGSHKQAADRT
jgi:hypothetical protein